MAAQIGYNKSKRYKNMMRILFMILVFAIIAFIITIVFKFFVDINTGSKTVRKDIGTLKKEMSNIVARLIPMSAKELELLSTNHISNTTIHGLGKVHIGEFTTIFEEPLLAYAYKKYGLAQEKALLMVSTAEDDFIYHSQENMTKVFINNIEIGHIESNGDLIANITQERIGHIDANQILSSHSVIVGRKEVGEVVNAASNTLPSARAYQYLEAMDDHEAKIFKALTFFTLIEETYA